MTLILTCLNCNFKDVVSKDNAKNWICLNCIKKGE